MLAASPCPPPPPSVADPADCPYPVNFSNGDLSPGCYDNDCAYYGWAKLNDGVETGIRSLGHTLYGINPHMQLDLGITRSDVSMIRLVARSDCCLEQSQFLNVYASNTTDFTGSGSVTCATNITFPALGAALRVLCPVNAAMRYVTVQKSTGLGGAASGRRLQQTSGGVFSLQEVQALMNGEWMHCRVIC